MVCVGHREQMRRKSTMHSHCALLAHLHVAHLLHAEASRTQNLAHSHRSTFMQFGARSHELLPADNAVVVGVELVKQCGAFLFAGALFAMTALETTLLEVTAHGSPHFPGAHDLA